jgi:hypothetical protein
MNQEARLRQILNRQANFAWEGKYEPAIKASTHEGPKISRISQINSLKLGRSLHLLSQAERFYAQFALYHPDLIDLHEQKMLSPAPTDHPLSGHPLAVTRNLSPVKGTVDVADRIGLRHHAVTVRNKSGDFIRAPYPYVGDLLLYMLDAAGEPYCVNWTVKNAMKDFSERRAFNLKTLAQQKKDREHGELRTLLEELYYLDAGIRTVKVSLDEINRYLVSNINELFSYHVRKIHLEIAVREDFIGDIHNAIVGGDPIYKIVNDYGRKSDTRDQFITAFYQAIWSRSLAVNLYSPIFIDYPLTFQEQDPLVKHEDLFRRGVK